MNVLKNKKLLIAVSAVFTVAEIVFAVLVQKVSGDANRYVSYGSVVLACLFCAIFAEKSWIYCISSQNPVEMRDEKFIFGSKPVRMRFQKEQDVLRW